MPAGNVRAKNCVSRMRCRLRPEGGKGESSRERFEPVGLMVAVDGLVLSVEVRPTGTHEDGQRLKEPAGESLPRYEAEKIMGVDTARIRKLFSPKDCRSRLLCCGARKGRLSA